MTALGDESASTLPESLTGVRLSSGRIASVQRAFLVAAMLLVGTVVAMSRVGSAGCRGVVWAEDGAVFLADAYRGGLSLLLHPYNGYAVTMNRLIAVVVGDIVPIRADGVALNLAAALGQSALAVLAKSALSGIARSSWVGWVAWAYVLVVPVGPETAVNVANLQWFMLGVACLAVIWEPRGWLARGASVLVVTLLALSCPFGAVTIGVAAVGWVVTRSRYHAAMTAVALAASAVEWAVMATAPSRTVSHHVELPALVGGFFRRVIGDGFWGIGSIGSASFDVPWWHIALPVAAWLSMFVIVVRHTPRAVIPALWTLVLAVGIYAVPTTLSGTAVSNPYYWARYFVAPAILVVSSLLLLCAGAMSVVEGWRRAIPLTVSCLVVALLAWGAVSSFRAPQVFRHGGPGWSAGVDQARQSCGGRKEGVASVPIAPANWQAIVPCRLLGAP